MEYTHVVIEHYPDGGIWKHFARSLDDAMWIAETIELAHPSRVCEVIKAGALS